MPFDNCVAVQIKYDALSVSVLMLFMFNYSNCELSAWCMSPLIATLIKLLLPALELEVSALLVNILSNHDDTLHLRLSLLLQYLCPNSVLLGQNHMWC